MFAYCGNNPVLNIDTSGMRHEIGAGAVGPFNKSEQNLHGYKQPTPKGPKEPTVSFFNYVGKAHITTPKAMLDFGWFWGKIGFSSTITSQDKEPGLVHSYTDIGNNENRYAVGINIAGWFGANVGASSNLNVFVSGQCTPWLHNEISIGLDGIGGTVGVDIGSIAYDFEINGGWGPIITVISVAYAVYSGQPIPGFS